MPTNRHNMKGAVMPEIENRISLGNVITLAILLISGLLAFSSVQGQTTSHEKQIDDHEGRIRVLETTITGSLSRIDARLSQIEKELAK